ncbi:EGF-like module-containing mucin-like hormone receptor-like 3, partial [Ophiophagus hannah]
IQTNLISPESFENNEALKLKAKGDQIAIHPRAVALTAMITDPIAVAFISHGGLESLLEETLLQNGTFQGNEILKDVHMNSRLVSVFTSNQITNISTPVNLTFQHLQDKVAQEKVLCVHLNSGALSDHGCQWLFSNITHTECSCQYLSSFAVLMATTHKQILCSVITGILKYLFLACFVWMFLEAVNLYLIVKNLKVANYSGASKYMKISMYLIGYGFPVLIVAISAAINPEAFGTLYRPYEVCHNVGRLTFCYCCRSLMFKAIAHVFILGVTWCFGLFQYGPLEDVMAYMFTIFNSVQGIFIFLVHCLLNQKVMLVSVSARSNIQNISTPVNLTFQHLKDKVAQEEVLCVHLNSGALSNHGCQRLFSNITHTECSCQYLSSFAVLMATSHKHGDPILTIISFLGLSISIICLFLCIVTFLFCRSSHNSSTFIHLQLSCCLFLADLLFITGIDKTGIKILCSVIAGILKYLFLACFVWMFLEAVNLYLIVRNLKVANYSGASKYMKISMYLIGYGFPVLIVAISAAIKPGAFGTLYNCWLDPGFIWSFMGPVCVIIVVNLVFFCLILKNLHKKLASLNSAISSVKNTSPCVHPGCDLVFWPLSTWLYGRHYGISVHHHQQCARNLHFLGALLTQPK